MNVQLGPGIGIARVPTAGRNFEYLCGEDPYLGAKLVTPIIKGIQSNKIIANAKHYINNEIEDERQTVSADVSERARFELYYPVFQAAIDAGVLSVMCAYNRVNDIHACENPDTLSHLKDIMGFNGWVMSDWMATHSTADSLIAGLDQELPFGLYYSNIALTKSLLNNNITLKKIDESVIRILTSMISIGMFEENYYDGTENPNNIVSTSEHISLAREIVAKCTVLLKNQNNLLPLKITNTMKRIVVIGDNSTVSGLGSGYVPPAYIITHAQGIENMLKLKGYNNIEVIYNDGNDINIALNLAESSDIVVIVVATTSKEGADRKTLSLGDHQNQLVSTIANSIIIQKLNNMIVSIITPGASLLPWNNEIPGAILLNWLPGQELGNGFADIIFGEINPSGKLPITIPNKDNEINFTNEQYPGTGYPRDAIYSEELLIGYRWYNQNNIKPLYPFGFGLSYTLFEYNNFLIKQIQNKIELNIDIKNIGLRDGDEIVQVYITYPDIAKEPINQLRQFSKVSLKINEIKSITLILDIKDFSIWNSELHNWESYKNMDYIISIGSSSRDFYIIKNIQLL